MQETMPLPSRSISVPSSGVTKAGLRTPRTGRSRRKIAIALAIAVVAISFALLARGRGWKTGMLVAVGLAKPKVLPPAQFVVTEPLDGAIDVPADTPLFARMRKGRSIDPKSVSARTVHLVRVPDQEEVEADISASDESTIAVMPRKPLEPRKQYALYVTPRVRTTDGTPVAAFLTSFTTAGENDPDLQFEKIALPVTEGVAFTCVAMGPDNRLWASSVDGRMFRFPVAADGTLETPDISISLHQAEGGPRLLTGFCFVPSTQTGAPPAIVASHSYFAFENVPDHTGKVSRLSGANLEIVEDLVTNLPRSSGDHATNQPSFGPDGALYIPQPSNTASGAPDPLWNNRDEHLFSATILRLDMSKLVPGRPLDVRTVDAGGSYDPTTPGAPLTIYASGVRLSYDLLWHSSGRLLSAVNGASAGGNTPNDPSQSGSAVTALTCAENDWLLDVKPGGFYGHANPASGHLVLNGANPTDRFDFGEVPEYPVGTRPDSRYRQPLLVLGQHISANGMIEYTGSACRGKLDKRVLICRYARGSDILIVTLDKDGRFVRQDFGLPGLKDFRQPLDITEDRRTGYLYVSEFGAKCITLIRPLAQ